tara:strand:+ start:2598 stop:3332 length:735 start_codon:yes stop_codon:yes gene_type:complete
MNWGNFFELSIELGLFLIASYFIFYKSWLNAIGEKMADLSTKKELMTLEEGVKKDFNEKLEAYKAKLSEELAIKIEPLKSELEKNNISHQIEYSYLHQERAKVIVEIYRKLNLVKRNLQKFTERIRVLRTDNQEELTNEKLTLDTAFEELKGYFEDNSLFFSITFRRSFEELLSRIVSLKEIYRIHQTNGFMMKMDQQFEEIEKMLAISKEIREELPTQIQQIEDEFQKLLNVTNYQSLEKWTQ